MSKATIRRADADDQEDVLNLWLTLMDEQAALEPRLDVAEDAAERWRNDFPEWIRDETRRLFVAERTGEIVGFLSAERYTPPPVYTTPGEVYINELYVQQGARRQGLGQRLAEAVTAWADSLEAERLRLGVLTVNETGRAFWQDLGAKPLSETLTITLGASSDRGASEAGGNIGF